MESLIVIDRRMTGRGSSVTNRQRYLHRIKDSVKAAKNIQLGNTISGNSNTMNPIQVARKRLAEPTIHYEHMSGDVVSVVYGNDHYERGDEIQIQSEGEGSGGSGSGAGSGSGEDDFIVHVSKEEFLNIFFEDCELPNLQQNSQKVLKLPSFQKAGFTTSGSPAQMSVIRSYRNSFARRQALQRPIETELLQLADRHFNLSSLEPTPEIENQLQLVNQRIEELNNKLKKIPYFDDIDLRYRRVEPQTKKCADAVFIMIMDISGSMDEQRKTLARKFFSLQYAFIKKHYPDTELVFIAHTEEAMEMQEDEFFETRISGGTIISPAYELADKIIKERYDPSVTNIYLSQATDGDNMQSDNARIIDVLENGMLDQVRHMSFIQVCPESGTFWSNSYSDGAWTAVQSVANTIRDKIGMGKVKTEGDVFPVFKEIYKKG